MESLIGTFREPLESNKDVPSERVCVCVCAADQGQDDQMSDRVSREVEEEEEEETSTFLQSDGFVSVGVTQNSNQFR